MKHGATSFFPALIVTLFAAPLAAWADANPDFDDDAKPILRAQPGLIHFIESRFDVKDTGTAKYPGDDDRRPAPPYIFRARPLGSSGPYNLRLLIQPGPPDHILRVVDMTKVHLTEPGAPTSPPAMASQPPTQPPQRPPQTFAPTTPAPATQIPDLSAPAPAQAPAQQPSGPTSDTPSGPTADTPSGPIMDSGSQAPPSASAPSSPAPSSGQPSYTPPPDPAPGTH